MQFSPYKAVVTRLIIMTIIAANSSFAYSQKSILPPRSWSDELCKEEHPEKDRCIQVADFIDKLFKQDPIGSAYRIQSNLEEIRDKDYSQNVFYYLGVFASLRGADCAGKALFKIATLRKKTKPESISMGLMINGEEFRGEKLVAYSVYSCGLSQFKTYEPNVWWNDDKAIRQYLGAPVYTTRPSPDGKRTNWSIEAWRKQEQQKQQSELKMWFPHRYRSDLVSTKLKDYGLGIGLTGAIFFIPLMAFSLAISETPRDAFVLGVLQKNADPMASATGVDAIKGVMYGAATLAGIGITLGLTGLAVGAIVDTNKEYAARKRAKIKDEDYFINIGNIVEK